MGEVGGGSLMNKENVSLLMAFNGKGSASGYTSDDKRSERSLWYVSASSDRGRNLSTSNAILDRMIEVLDNLKENVVVACCSKIVSDASRNRVKWPPKRGC